MTTLRSLLLAFSLIFSVSMLAAHAGTLETNPEANRADPDFVAGKKALERKDWKTAEGQPVANEDLWKALSTQVAVRKPLGKIEWKYVRGHSGIPGNERVDEIAVAFAQGSRPRLYLGPLLKYDIAIHDLPENTEVPEMRPKQAAKPKAYSYLSLVNGVAMRHLSWTECEARVKGRPGAKFKKAMSEEEELEILRSWGVRTPQY